MQRSLLFLLLFCTHCLVFSQSDSTAVEKPQKEKKERTKKVYPTDTSYHHSVKTAALLSTFIPGGGQLYNEYGYRKYRSKKNRAWWKAPLIYGGLGTLGYFFYDNYNRSKLLKEEYLIRQDNPGLAYHHPDFADLDSIALISDFDFYSRRRDIFAFVTIAFYGLQIVEAVVDAHFVSFDVSENLTFRWSPTLLTPNTAGLKVGLEFKSPTIARPHLRF